MSGDENRKIIGIGNGDTGVEARTRTATGRRVETGGELGNPLYYITIKKGTGGEGGVNIHYQYQ